MIRAERANSPSAHVLRRSRTMEVERLSLTEFRVKPSEEGKEVRLVRFHLEYAELDDRDYLPVGVYGPVRQPAITGILIECFAERTGESCGANARRRYCSHIEAAICYLLIESGDYTALRRLLTT